MASEYVTIAELEAKYPGQWVLLDRPTVNDNDDVTGGRLVMHHADRAVFDAELPAHPLDNWAVMHVYDPNAEPVELLPFWVGTR